MKLHKSLLLFSTAGVIALSANPSFSQSNSSDSLSFRCRDINGIPTTEVYNSKNPEKNLPLIRWKSDLIDSQNIQEDCNKAASRLESRYRSQSGLNFTAIDSKNINKQYVFCLTNSPGESCAVSNDKLFYLKPTLKQTNLKEVHIALSNILDPNFVPPNRIQEVRGGARTYAKIPSKRTWFSYLGIIIPGNR